MTPCLDSKTFLELIWSGHGRNCQTIYAPFLEPHPLQNIKYNHDTAAYMDENIYGINWIFDQLLEHVVWTEGL